MRGEEATGSQGSQEKGKGEAWVDVHVRVVGGMMIQIILITRF